MSTSVCAAPSFPVPHPGVSVSYGPISSAVPKVNRIPFVRHGPGDSRHQEGSVSCRPYIPSASQPSTIRFVRHGSGDLRYQGGSVSCRQASSAAPTKGSMPFMRHGSGDLPSLLGAIHSSNFHAAQRSPRILPVHHPQASSGIVGASSLGGRSARTTTVVNKLTPHNVVKRVPPNYNPDKKIAQLGPAASMRGSVTQPLRRTSTPLCETRQRYQIASSGASNVDGRLHGGSISTTASDGATITSTAGNSIITNGASTSVGGSVTVAASLSTEVNNFQTVEEEEPDNMNCNVVAFKENGLPLIWRLENKDTGKVQTIVEHENGSVKAFGDSTMSSVSMSEEAKTLKFVDSLTDIDLRGFVHEIDQRVIESFHMIDKKQKEFEKLLDEVEREYFGIGQDATKNDLDKAYRKMAKKMHPDKNGGTDYAKQAFQNMFERYKRLRCKCRESVDELNLASRYVNRILLRACVKEDEGVRCYVDRLSAKCFIRGSSRKAAKDIEPGKGHVQIPPTESRMERQEKGSDEDYTSRSYLEKQARILIRKYKALQQNVANVDRDLEKLQATRTL